MGRKALRACSKNTPSRLLALQVAAKAPKRTEGMRAGGPRVAVLEVCQEARQCAMMAAVHQDIGPGLLPRVCSQPGVMAASIHDVRDWLIPPVEQLLLDQQPGGTVQKLYRQPGVASTQLAPHHHRNGTDGMWCVFPNCWHHRSDKTKPLRV